MQAGGCGNVGGLGPALGEASKYVPLDQICLSGQCGFSPTFEDNALTYDNQVAKLRLIVETARDIWGD